MKKIAVYPGSFDPITNGHIDIIERGLRMFDELIVLIAYNPNKKTLFSVAERQEMIRNVIKDYNNVRVDCFDGLLVDFVKNVGANVILRGLRALSDFEYEFQLALINRRLNREIETVFLMTGYKWFYTSSTIINEAASLGGSVKGLVPDIVNEKLMEKSFLSAKLYYNIDDYKAAIVALNICLVDFPETKYREEIMFMLLKSKYLLAEKSIQAKQTERYQDAVDEYFAFITEFPESKNKKEAEDMYQIASQYIKDKETDKELTDN